MHKGQLYGLGNAVLLDGSVSVVVVAVDVEDVIDDEAVVFIVEDLACFLGVILVQREVEFWGSVFLSSVLETRASNRFLVGTLGKVMTSMSEDSSTLTLILVSLLKTFS